MQLMKCPECGQPLVYEEAEVMTYRVSADGSYLINSSIFAPTPRIDKDILCPACGAVYFWTLEDKEDRLKLLHPVEEN